MDTIKSMTNAAILKTIGENLERIRIEMQIPDTEVCKRGGIKKGSWYNLKAGGNVTIDNLCKALRGLECLDLLSSLVVYENEPSPMDLIRKKRSAYSKRIRRKKEMVGGVFEWGDEK